MAASELLIAIVAFCIFPVIFLAAGTAIAVFMKPPPPEPLYRPQDWGCQDVDRRKQ
jgi:hypothetical protein